MSSVALTENSKSIKIQLFLRKFLEEYKKKQNNGYKRLNRANDVLGKLAVPCLGRQILRNGPKESTEEDASELWIQLLDKLSDSEFEKQFIGLEETEKTCNELSVKTEKLPYTKIGIRLPDESPEKSLQQIIDSRCNEYKTWKLENDAYPLFTINFEEEGVAESFNWWLRPFKSPADQKSYIKRFLSDQADYKNVDFTFLREKDGKTERLTFKMHEGLNFWNNVTWILEGADIWDRNKEYIVSENKTAEDASVDALIDILKKHKATIIFYRNCMENAREKTCFYAVENQQYVSVTLDFDTSGQNRPQITRYTTLIKEEEGLELKTYRGVAKQKFRLTGMVLQGLSPKHYIALIRTTNGWFKVDDASVSKPQIKWAKLLPRDDRREFIPYLLFYSKGELATGKPIGLINNGRNICYANALLQNLANLPNIVDTLPQRGASGPSASRNALGRDKKRPISSAVGTVEQQLHSVRDSGLGISTGYLPRGKKRNRSGSRSTDIKKKKSMSGEEIIKAVSDELEREFNERTKIKYAEGLAKKKEGGKTTESTKTRPDKKKKFYWAKRYLKKKEGGKTTKKNKKRPDKKKKLDWDWAAPYLKGTKGKQYDNMAPIPSNRRLLL